MENEQYNSEMVLQLMAVALVHHFCSPKVSLEVPFFLAMFS